MYKQCDQCEEELELNEDNFHRDQSSKDGFFHLCKSCRKVSRSQAYKEDLSSVKIEKPIRSRDNGFDDAAFRDWLYRDMRIYSIDQEAF